MRKQFENVECRFGAPMGRPEVLKDFSGRSRCFKVNLYGGGCYDDGNCYWGGPSNLYCATNGKGYDGFMMFTRANSRQEAKAEFKRRANKSLYGHLNSGWNQWIGYHPAIKWIN